MELLSLDMHDITRCQNQSRREFMAQFELEGLHAKYIEMLCSEPGISQEQLSKKLYVNKSNVARQLSALEKQGWICRAQDASDKRILRVYPTQRAVEIYPKIADMERQWDAFITLGLSEEERQTAAMLLRKMKKQADIYMENRA
ncbi:MAG: MarR family transcriptional regulator [Clostridia bacterium]|nr:MarR family transcriptional regulator [Clostridia bacterium]